MPPITIVVPGMAPRGRCPACARRIRGSGSAPIRVHSASWGIKARADTRDDAVAGDDYSARTTEMSGGLGGMESSEGACEAGFVEMGMSRGATGVGETGNGRGRDGERGHGETWNRGVAATCTLPDTTHDRGGSCMEGVRYVPLLPLCKVFLLSSVCWRGGVQLGCPGRATTEHARSACAFPTLEADPLRPLG